MDPFTATGLAGLSGPSRLGDSFFLECYCVVLHYTCADMRGCARHKRRPTESLLFHDAR